MMISSKGRYALRVMIDLAEHAEEGYIPLQTIAARQGISHNTKNLRIVGVYQRIILAIVHGQKIFFAVHNNIGMVNSWHSANWPTHHIGIITICISGASRTD